MRLCLHFCTRYELTRSGTMDAEHVNGLHSGDTRAVLDRHGNLSFLINCLVFFLSLSLLSHGVVFNASWLYGKLLISSTVRIAQHD